MLNAEEEKILQEKLPEEFQPEEVQKVMELTTSWHLKGWQEILLKQLRKRLRTISPEVEARHDLILGVVGMYHLDILAASPIAVQPAHTAQPSSGCPGYPKKKSAQYYSVGV